MGIKQPRQITNAISADLDRRNHHLHIAAEPDAEIVDSPQHQNQHQRENLAVLDRKTAQR